MELSELIMELREEEKASSQVPAPLSRLKVQSDLGSDSMEDQPEIYKKNPNLLGAVILRNHDGTPLVFNNDPPHIRVFGWALIKILFVPWEPTDLEKIAKDCAMTISEARKGLAKLIQEGDLMVKRERGREYYWLAPLRFR